MKNLLEIKLGTYAYIDGISNLASTKIKRRLLDLGFTKGQKVRCVHKSMLGKDFLLELRHFTLSLRGEIVKYILVKSVGEK